MPQNTISAKPSFKAYLKFKDSPKKIDRLIDTVQNAVDDAFFINHKKGKNKDSVCLLTGGHYDKFLDFLNDIKYAHMPEVRKKISEILGEKPVQKDAEKVTNAIKHNKFDFKTGKIK